MINWEDINTKNKIKGTMKTVCPNCSHTRKKKNDPCLYVNLDDGVAKCYNCDNLAFRDGFKESLVKSYTLPSQQWRNYTKLSEKLVKWFEEERGIKQFTLNEFGITEEKVYQPAIRKEANSISFNYFEGETLVNKKFRDGSKNFTQSKNGKPILYNINSCIGAKEVYILEGEIDVLTLWQLGIKSSVSLPSGANDNDNYWINSEPYLKDVEKFYIGTDNDEKGDIVAEKIAQRLGRYKCVRIKWTNKDANEDLIAGVLEESIKNIVEYPVSGTITHSSILSNMLELKKNGIPKTIKPKNKRFESLNEIFSILMGQLTVVTGVPSHGKALCINTLIPTPKGFVKMIDLKVGDSVFDEKGKECFVKWKSEIWEDRPTYKLTFSDNSSIICDENHEWLTDTWKSRRSKSNALKNDRLLPRDLKNKGNDQTHKRTFESVKTTKEISETMKVKEGRNNHSIKLSLPIDLKENKLLIDPYVLGCWLGDGHSDGGGFTSKDIDLVNHIKSKGYDVRNHNRDYGYGILGIKTQLRDLNLLKNKHIPDSYLFSSIEQRFELLRGLMDTDGHCSIIEARNEFCGVNYELVRGVYRLVCSLGIKATFVEGDAILNNKKVSKKYRVFFKTNSKVFNLERKQNVIDNYFKNRSTRGNENRYITKCEVVEGYRTQCIEVSSESHLFLAGEQFIPTHNSNFIEDYVLSLSNDYDFKVSLFSPEHHPSELHAMNLASKVIGKNSFTSSDNEVIEYSEWANERIYFTVPEDDQEPNWTWLLETFKAQMLRFGINIFIIDAWNKVILNGRNGLQEITNVLTKITSFAQKNNVHIFLIAHPTKMTKIDGTDKYKVPDLYSVAGSADFRNQTHNGLCVYRDFDEGITQVFNLKTKFSFQGEIGKNATFKYDVSSSRYNDVESNEFDRLNYVNNTIDVRIKKDYEIPRLDPSRSFFDQVPYEVNNDEIPF